MKQFKRTMSLILAFAMLLSMMPSFGTHVHAEELETEPVVETTAAVEETTEPQPTTEAPTEKPTETPTEAPTKPSEEPTKPSEESVKDPTESSEVEEIVVSDEETEAPAAGEAGNEEIIAEFQAQIDDMLNWYLVELGGLTLPEGELSEEEWEEFRSEVEAAVAKLTTDDIWMAQVELYDLEEAMLAALTEEEIVALVEGNPVLCFFADAVYEYSVGPNALDDTMLLDGRIKVSNSGGTVGATGDNSYVITAKGGILSKGTATLTITNTSGEKGTLQFTYTASTYSSFQVAGANANASGNYSITLEPDASVTVKIVSNSGLWNTTATLTLSGVSFNTISAAKCTFVYDSTMGSITVGGTAVTNGTAIDVPAEGVAITATPANSNVTFLGWINANNGQIISSLAADTLLPTGEMTVKAVFASKTSNAIFGVGSYIFDDLIAANNKASDGTAGKTIALLADGILPAGNYTISSGNTLLIPHDAANTVRTTTPATVENTSHVKPTAFRTLTMAANAKITVNGAVSIGGSQNAVQPYNGMVTGPVGFITMQSGSSISVENGAFLYAWGYITGSGSVEVKSGGTVYEDFQLADFRGGSALRAMSKSTQVFPMSQYYLQNIEVPLKLNAGANEKAYMSTNAGGLGIHGCEVPAVGSGTSSAMFKITSGYVIKDYIEGTGRIQFTTVGDISVSAIKMSLNVGFTVSIDSTNYNLPIPGHFTINAVSGAVTMDQSLALLPGAEMFIGEGVNGTLAEGRKIILYDWDDWGPYCYNAGQKYIPLQYAPGGLGTVGREKDALVQLDGTMNASAGAVYTTSGGAAITSTGTGVAVITVGDETVTHQVTQSGSNITYVDIAINPAWLRNGDGTFVKTAGAEANTTYEYCATHDCWYTGSCASCSCDANGHTANADDGDCTTAITCAVCGEVVIPGNAAHIPNADDGDCTTAITCAVCGKVVIPGNAAHTAEADDGDCTTAITCSVCGKVTTEGNASHTPNDDDGNCETAITCRSCTTVTTAAKTHVDADKNHTCDNAGCTISQGTHAAATGKHTCDYCGETITKCADNLAKTEENASNCVNPGHKAYWTCSVCGKNYSDDAATAEIADLNAWKAENGDGYIAVLSHAYTYTANEELDTITERCDRGCNHNATLTLYAPTNLTYDGETKAAVVNGELKNAIGVVTYKQGEDALTETPVNAGTYTATLSVEEVSVSVSFVIEKADPAITTAPQAITGLTYNSKAQELIVPSEAAVGKLVYSLSENGEYTETIPTGKDAANYTVYYKVIADDNYSDTVKSITVTILQKSITDGDVTLSGTYVYTGEEQTVSYTVADGVTYDVTGTTGTDAGQYELIIIGTGNYTGTVAKQWTIAQKAVAEPTVIGTYTYNRNEQTVALTGVETYMTVGTGTTGTNAGDYEVTITLDNNHQWAEGSDGKVQWTIGKAQAVITVDTATVTVTYGEAVTLPTAKSNFGTVSCDRDAASLKNADTYTVTYTVAGTDNYDGATKDVTVEIKQATVTITADSKVACLGNAQPALSYKVEGLVGTDVLITAPTLTTDAVMSTNGTYTITATGANAGSNYTIVYVGGTLTVQDHGFDTNTGLCPVCKKLLSVASVKIGETTTYYKTLNEAVTKAGEGTETAPAILTLLDNIDLGTAKQDITGGTLSIDLNGFKLKGGVSSTPALYITGGNVTITDGVGGGIIEGVNRSVQANGCTLVIAGGKISTTGTSTTYGVYAQASSEVTITGGTISAQRAVYANPGSVTITGGTIVGSKYGVQTTSSGTVTITGGTIEGAECDLYGANITLGLGENGIGATFPGGVKSNKALVTHVVPDVSAYWQGDKMVIVTAEQKEITGGDVVIKAECKHNKTYTKNDDATHAWFCAACQNEGTEDHTWDNGVIDPQPTCTEEGVKTYTCTADGCGATYTEPVSATGHSFGEITAANAATCLAPGNEAYKQCSVCSLYFAADAADDSTEGKTDTTSFVIAQLTHSYTGAVKSDGDGKDATHSFLCVNGCNQYGGTVAHTWNAGEETTAPGCETKGVMTFTCTVAGCGATYTEAIANKGHSYTYTADDVADTITETCANNCGHSAELKLAAPAELVYDGNVKEASVTGEIVGTYELTYSDETINAGTYTATLTVGEASVSVEFAIAKATPTVTAPVDLTATYGDTLSDVVLPEGWAWEDSTASVGDAGKQTFNAIYTHSDSANYETVTAQVTVVVEKTASSIKIIPAAVSGLIYNGDEQALITAGDAVGGEMQYSLDGETWSETIPTAANAGEYTVYYKVVGDANHNDVAEQSVTVTIGKADATITAPSTNELTYTGTTQTLVTAGTANGGTVQYKLGDGEWTTEIPTAINAGEYTVYYKVVGDANHNGVTEQYVTVTIGKADATITAPASKELTYTGTAQALVTAGTAVGGTVQYKLGDGEWTTGIPTAINAGKYTVSYKVVGDANHNDVAEQSVTVTINKLAVAEPTASGTYTYNGNEQTVALTGVEAYMTDVSGNKATNAGNYEVTITLDGNHTWAEGSDGKVQWSIGKAAVTVTADSYTVCVDSQLPELKFTPAGLIGEDKLTIEPSLSTEAEMDTVGEYEITITGADEDGNYTITYVGGKLTVKAHSFDPTNGECSVCQTELAVASVKIGESTTYYETLADAVAMADDGTETAPATLTLLADIDLGSGYQEIKSGVFTLDLNGFELAGTNSGYGVLFIQDSKTNITITDGSAEQDGTITGEDFGVLADGSTVTISGGAITGGKQALLVSDSTVTITGGTITGKSYAMTADNSTVKITGGTISGGNFGVLTTNSIVTVTGGTITSNDCGLEAANSTVTITGGTITGKTGVRIGGGTAGITGGTITGESCGVRALSRVIVTISGADTAITGTEYGVYADDSTVEISGGTITGDYGVYATSGTVEITGGSITGESYGVYAPNSSTVTITGEDTSITATGTNSYGVYASSSTVEISGGTITSANFGVFAARSDVEISGGIITGGTGTISTIQYGVYASSSTVEITGGTITGGSRGVSAGSSTLTIEGGTITGGTDGVYALSGSTAEISGGTITGGSSGVYAGGISTVTIKDGSISGTKYGVYAGSSSIVTITGGEISGTDCDLNSYNSTFTLGLGEKGVGATFPGGVSVNKTTLNACLAEGAAYWASNKMLADIADDATAITDQGDIIIKAVCDHVGTEKTYTENEDGTTHTVFCTACQNTVTATEAHIFDSTDGKCECGHFMAVASVKIGESTTYFETLADAVALADDGTETAPATLTLLADIDLGSGYQEITSGVFTLDLNGFELASTGSNVLYITGTETDVTITDSDEGGTITGGNRGVYATNSSTVTIEGGTISGNYGVYAYSSSTVIISDGTISGTEYGVYANGSEVEITGGTITATVDYGYGVYASNSSTVKITGKDTSITATGTNSNGVCAGGSSTVTISGGSITGYYGVYAYKCTVTISGGTITGEIYGVFADRSAVEISGGIITGGTITATDNYSYGVYAYSSTVKVTGGTITTTGDYGYGVYATESSTVTIKDGSISGTEFGVYADDSTVEIAGGTITATGEYGNGVYAKNSSKVEITGGTISGAGNGVYTEYSTMTIKGGTISNAGCGVNAYESDVTISGGTITGVYNGVSSSSGDMTITGGEIFGTHELATGLYACFSDVTIEDCTITVAGENTYGVHVVDSTMTINGGKIISDYIDICNAEESTITLGLGEEGVGATFPGGITVKDTTLNACLAEGAAYWQGTKMILPAEGATEITGGDVVIKAVCDHLENESTEYTYVDETGHSVVCSKCGVTFTADHDALTYVDQGETGHKTYFPCCQTAADAAETVAHTLGTVDTCACDYKAKAKIVDTYNGDLTVYYATLPEALAAVDSWDIKTGLSVSVYAMADYNGDFTVPKDAWFYGEGFTFSGAVTNEGYIESGTFTGEVTNNGSIYKGTFEGVVTNNLTIAGGTFNDEVTNNGDIWGGTFNDTLTNNEGGVIEDHGTAITIGEGFQYVNAGGTVTGVHAFGDQHKCWCGAVEAFNIIFVNGDVTVSNGMQTYGEKLVTPEVTKEGHTFAGWIDENRNTYDTVPAIEDLYLFATWNRNSYAYTVETYTMDEEGNYGEPVVDTLSAEYEQIVTLTPVIPEHFTLDSEKSALQLTIGTNEDENVLKVYLKRNQYTITFVDTGDAPYAPITMYYGADVAPVADPMKTGYTFLGWDVVFPDTMPGGGLTITAQWQIKTYTVSMSEYHTSVEIASVNGDTKAPFTVEHGQKLEIFLKNTASQKRGDVNVVFYDVNGSSNFVGEYINASAIPFTISGEEVTGNVEIVADALVLVTVNMAGGACTNTSFYTIDDGVATVIDSWSAVGTNLPMGNHFVKNGHTLAKLVDSEGNVYGAKDGIGFRGDLELTLVWKCDALTHVEATPATCTDTGILEHWICSCGKTYADENGEKELESVVSPIKPDAHAYELAGYTNDGETHTEHYICAHNESHTKDVSGVAHDFKNDAHTCVCGAVEKFTVTFYVDGKMYAESLVAFGEAITAPADPTKDKNVCTVYTFTGWAEEIPETMPAENLTFHATFSEELEHTPGETVIENNVDPDCENAGSYDNVVYCTVCETELSRKPVIVPELGHKPGETVIENNVDPDCENAGSYDNVVYCTVCEDELSRDTVVVEKLGHKPGETVIENNVDPDCENAGSYDNVVYCTVCEEELNRDTVVVERLGHNHENDPIYTDLGDGNHSVTCGDCKEIITASEPHTFEGDEHTCICGAVETFTITWIIDGVETSVEVTFNTLPEAPVAEKAADDAFTYEFKSWDKEIVAATEDTAYTAIFTRTGWLVTEEGAQYLVKDEVQKSGWTEIGDAWYYLDPETGYRAEGVARVPYPTVTVAGNTYAPDQQAIDYAASKGVTFIDEKDGWFLFGEDGKFQSAQTGIGEYLDATRYVENGHIAWHAGMVADGEDHYYFTGDEEIGGNIMATGDVHVSRDNSGFGAVIGGIYTFGEDGKLCNYDGITDMADGTKRYYEDAQLMIGAGLVKIAEGKYIYVRSNGELVVNTEYWVAQVNDNTEINVGMAQFDEDGFMILDVPQTAKTGVYAENNAWVYYVNGDKQYNAGLILLPKGTEWFDAEGKSVKTADGASYVYVRSNAQLATGTYWITKTNDQMAVGKYDFDEFGLIQTQMNGIYYENGGLFFYKDNRILYNAGLIRYTGTSSEGVVYDNSWIYVRSNGQLATGTYWITNTNDEMASGKYEFDADGKMIVAQIADGIHTENGKLYYYVGGVKQVGTGLVQLPNGGYIYVKTTGELAVGDYWVTNTGDTGMSQGLYTFGSDGVMIR